MARTKNSKVTEKVNTEKIEEKVNIEALSNVDTIETELKEEYKEEIHLDELLQDVTLGKLNSIFR